MDDELMFKLLDFGATAAMAGGLIWIYHSRLAVLCEEVKEIKGILHNLFANNCDELEEIDE